MMLRAYPSLALGSGITTGMFRGLYGEPRLEPRLAVYKASAVLTLQHAKELSYTFQSPQDAYGPLKSEEDTFLNDHHEFVIILIE